MPRQKWDAKTKAMIVLEGLKGKPVAELCNEHQISQAQYYQWRDPLTAHAPKAFEAHKQSQREAPNCQGESHSFATSDLRLNVRLCGFSQKGQL